MKKYKAHDAEEHIDESWLIPYADILTLLLALFIVLFASSQIDQKKLDQLSQSFNRAFQGGQNILESPGSVPLNRDGLERGRSDSSENDMKLSGRGSSTSEGTQTDAAKAFMERYDMETVELEEIKEKIDEYIEENGLSNQLSTELNTEQLKINISDTALFDSGSANVKADSRKIAETISELLVKSPDYQVVVAGHTDDQPINTREFPSNWELSSKRALNFMKILLQNDALAPQRFSAVGYGEFQPIASNENARGRAQNRRVEVSIVRNFQQKDDPS